MKIGLLPVGQVNRELLRWLCEGSIEIFPESSCRVIVEELPLKKQAYNSKRNQFNSSLILHEVRAFADKSKANDRVLGVVDKDIFVPELNYVFGEAYTGGKAGLISLWRLKPEFYGEEANEDLFHQRILKEAVHEIGHTLGLLHCNLPTCVMHFSNSILDTDKKQSLFCDQCYLQATIATTNLG